MKFELHKQKPLIVKFYEKHSLVPKLLYVCKCWVEQFQCELCGAVSVLLCLQYTAFAHCYSCAGL